MRRLLAIPLAFAVVVTAASCGGDDSDASDGSVATTTGSSGTTGASSATTASSSGGDTLANCGMDVELDPPPERIFAINQTMIELTYSLGAGDRVVANAFLDNEILPEYADDLDAVEYFSGPPSREQVIAATPDLIAAQFPDNFTEQQMGSRASFEDMGVRTWLAEDLCPIEDGSLEIDGEVQSFERNFEAYRRYAKLLGPDAVQAAEALIAEQEAELEALADEYAAATPQPRVAFVQFGEGNEVYASGGHTMSQAIADAAGVENVFADKTDGGSQISIEQLITAAPDFLVVTTCCGEDMTVADVQPVIDQAKANPALAAVPAVQKDQFIPLLFTSLFAGVRNVDAARTIADIAHAGS